MSFFQIADAVYDLNAMPFKVDKVWLAEETYFISLDRKLASYSVISNIMKEKSNYGKLPFNGRKIVIFAVNDCDDPSLDELRNYLLTISSSQLLKYSG